ncbi:MAG TPA: LysE family transporter [Chlamydiales bacterium]|jgi:threonine/homoserine/homoserine lactone efflux protein|nr:LysE family transporter [Chlamydiales bacterium]
MDVYFLLKGAILGFSIAAPVGPIGILCIRKTLQFGRLSGFVSGLGAACADVLYGVIAAFGLTFISDFLLAGQFWFRLIGGIFLMALGGRIFFSQPADKKEGISHQTLFGDFFSTFFLTLSNPMTILSFLAVFAGLGLTEELSEYSNALILILGIFLGSALWWLILSEGVTLFRKKLSRVVMLWINRVAGLIISAFGLLALLSFGFGFC